MIRLTLLLCAGLYFALLVLGEDNGQKRYGLMLADEQAAEAGAAPGLKPAPDPVKDVVFIPSQTVMEPATVAATVVEVRSRAVLAVTWPADDGAA